MNQPESRPALPPFTPNNEAGLPYYCENLTDLFGGRNGDDVIKPNGGFILSPATRLAYRQREMFMKSAGLGDCGDGMVWRSADCSFILFSQKKSHVEYWIPLLQVAWVNGLRFDVRVIVKDEGGKLYADITPMLKSQVPYDASRVKSAKEKILAFYRYAETTIFTPPAVHPRVPIDIVRDPFYCAVDDYQELMDTYHGGNFDGMRIKLRRKARESIFARLAEPENTEQGF